MRRLRFAKSDRYRFLGVRGGNVLRAAVGTHPHASSCSSIFNATAAQGAEEGSMPRRTDFTCPLRLVSEMGAVSIHIGAVPLLSP